MSLTDDVDGWISQLMQCKPLSENEVKKLCEKVSSCWTSLLSIGVLIGGGKGNVKSQRVGWG